MHNDFKELVSYNRFLELRINALVPLIAFIQLNTINKYTEISFIDSFCLNVSHSKRIYSHKTFKHLSSWGKTSVGWFYGFKLYLVINQYGEIVSFYITSGSVSDNNNAVIVKLTKQLLGKIFGDKGYLLNKTLFQKLYSKVFNLLQK